ncbi:hypothetical protein L1987_42501 [Smallanthus sonchifolius]|uniref:Uncharacterized protein n=1 Tax=Smallanthus sonchifolius TaxID=185202 RepID=A0ACB9GIY4_9ASTR|nr:hypothetical protein L1987_42501 [Smallanthus sonchifolius]
MKTCETLTMSLPKEIIHSLEKCPTSRDLWEALKKKDLTDSESIHSGESTQSTETGVMTEASFQTVEDDLSELEIDTEPVIVAQKSEADDDVFTWLLVHLLKK